MFRQGVHPDRRFLKENPWYCLTKPAKPWRLRDARTLSSQYRKIPVQLKRPTRRDYAGGFSSVSAYLVIAQTDPGRIGAEFWSNILVGASRGIAKYSSHPRPPPNR